MKSNVQRLAVFSAVYDVEITDLDVSHTYAERSQDRVTALYWIRTARALPAHFAVKVTRRWEYRECEVTVCAGCGARPSLWDIDCDGPYDTVQCGRCDWFAGFNLRHHVAAPTFRVIVFGQAHTVRVCNDQAGTDHGRVRVRDIHDKSAPVMVVPQSHMFAVSGC